MFIHKVWINGFRSIKETEVELGETNVLIGPNNSGKTAFLEAIHYAIGFRPGTPSEDDFFVEGESFDPKTAPPIEVILEFREGFDTGQRFSDRESSVFADITRFDLDSHKEVPIRFFRMKYAFSYVEEKGRYEESRTFVDENFNVISGKQTNVRKEHLTYFPYFYLETLRDIKREIKNKSSFWGKMKHSVDYTSKKEQISDLVTNLNSILINEGRMSDIVERLKEIQNSIKISNDSDNIFLQAVSKRNWELLDGLNIYLKTANSNISLPIEKHGMGTQNIATLIIFNAYLDILLPDIVENDEVTPIVGIEEPEAHVYPHSQRSLFAQLSKIKGQKLISTHSPYIIDQANIHDYLLFRNEGGLTKIRRIPKFKPSFSFKYGLPEMAYEANRFFNKDELHMLKRYIQFKNTELFFANLFLMCEGDSEKIFLEMITETYLEQPLSLLGVSVVTTDGINYPPFLQIASQEALNIPWLIFSDGELDTVEKVRSMVKNHATGIEFEENVIYLPDQKDFEKYYIDWLGTDVIKGIISEKYGDKSFEQFVARSAMQTPPKYLEKTCQHCGELPFNFKPGTPSALPEKELINLFIDRKGKPIFAEHVAEFVIRTQPELPSELNSLFRRITEIIQ